MQKIASFQVDHTVLMPGLYLSRVDTVAGTPVYTYDIRLKRPNHGDYLTPAAAHTIEHIGATWLRNSPRKDDIIYFGPMGCQTGFYLVTTCAQADALPLVRQMAQFISQFQGDIPGASAVECGQYLLQDLEGARREATAYCQAIQGITQKDMEY